MYKKLLKDENLSKFNTQKIELSFLISYAKITLTTYS